MATQWKDFDPYHEFLLWPDTLWSRDRANYDHEEAFCRTRQTRYDPTWPFALFMTLYKVNERSVVVEGPVCLDRKPLIHFGQWLREMHYYQDRIARRMHQRFPLLFV